MIEQARVKLCQCNRRYKNNRSFSSSGANQSTRLTSMSSNRSQEQVAFSHLQDKNLKSRTQIQFSLIIHNCYRSRESQKLRIFEHFKFMSKKSLTKFLLLKIQKTFFQLYKRIIFLKCRILRIHIELFNIRLPRKWIHFKALKS
jgi:hypothetical protein